MLQALTDALTVFAITYAIIFVALIFLFKVCIGKVMKFLGADFYTFSVKKRLTIINIISLVIAVFLMFATLFG